MTNRTPNDGNAYAMSFNPQHTHSHPQTTSQTPQYVPAGNQGQASQNGGPMASPYKSFNDSQQYSNSMRSTAAFEKPQIYTAVYSGVQVYEMEVSGVACMRRRSDGWLNATQILKVAGIDKGKRTKVLEKEVLTGDHEKVQGGYGKYQGTWISYARGREFCRQYGVEDQLLPLLEYDLNGDGSGTGGQITETPTKEQAMAANRKKFYNSHLDTRNTAQSSQSTFFQNISPMSSMALAAMNKAARYNSPARPTSTLKRPLVQPSPAQQTLLSEHSFPEAPADSPYITQQNGTTAWRPQGQEPPRKRMRQSDDASVPVDASMMSIDATEPSESFLYGAQSFMETSTDRDELSTDQALPAPSTPQEEEKKALLLDLFADTARVDYTTHPAFTQLSSQDLSIPLDASANTALHWATTLSRINILRMLIQKGANIYSGNVAGHSALISAVLVNNCWERSSFPDVLELLSPLIEIRDAQGRTILHHIAVSCGIKGRAPSSKYYLEALLEFLVRSVKVQHPANVGQERAKPATLMSFLTNIVNARDKLGNTALNLVARIGNRSIIQQLLEIKADPSIPNYKGVSAKDFGVGVEDAEPGTIQSRSHLVNGNTSTFGNNSNNFDGAYPVSPQSRPVSASDQALQQDDAPAQTAVTEDQNQDVISSLTTMLTQNFAQHKQLLAAKAAEIDRLNAEIKDLSSTQKQESDALVTLQRRAKERSDRVAKVANLRRLIEERRRAQQLNARPPQISKKLVIGEAESYVPAIAPIVEAARKLPPGNPENANEAMEHLPHELVHVLTTLPAPDMRALLSAYERNNANLAGISSNLQKRSSQLEQLYRKSVALCTGVPEEKVEESLPLLVAAVESERGGLGREDARRVRDFLAKVEGVGEKDGQQQGAGGIGNGGDELEQTPRTRLYESQIQQQHRFHQQGRMGMSGMGGWNKGLMGPPELPA